MSSRTVALSVALALGFALVLVLIGATLDVSAPGIAAIVAAVAFGAGMLGLMSLLLTLIGTVRELTTAVERVTDQTVPLLEGVNETVSGVNTNLARVDTIVANVQHISVNAEKISDVLQVAVASPVIKAMAYASGARTAVRSLRVGSGS